MKVALTLNLSYSMLLKSYAERIRRSLPQAEEHALLAKSVRYRDVLATAVAGRGTTFEELSEKLDELGDGDINFEALASLGRIVALQNIYAEDRSTGLRLLRIANENLPHISSLRKYRQLEFELIFESASFEEAENYLDDNPELKELQNGYLEVDLYNPFKGSKKNDYGSWIRGFNRIFEEDERSPVTLRGEAKNPFDRLVAENDLHHVIEGPLVSVIMTSYDPEPEAFLAAAQSILNQTWRNLELIIVDDASPNRANNLLERLAELDSRVRVILLDENGGTYQARNVGLKVAAGEFITGQDSDDWSHPERLECQVKYLLENPEAAGVMTSAVRTDENLCRIMPGLSPTRKCEVSFMTPLQLAREVGGYLNARKAADSEFRQRIEFYSNRTVGVIRDTLYIIRLMPNSLSRGDFSSGWSHQSRRAFWNAALYWHSSTPASALSICENVPDPLPIPPRFQIEKPKLNVLDIVLVADWRISNGWLRCAVEEAEYFVSSGFRVGMMQMESPNSIARTSFKPNWQIQSLINDGQITQVTTDQDIVIKNLIFHDPSIMQFPTTQESNLDVGKIIMAPFELASEANCDLIRYSYSDCSNNAQKYFSAEVLWTFPKGLTQGFVEVEESGMKSLHNEWPLVLDLNRWSEKARINNSQHRSTPIIGRSCHNNALQWPEKDVIEQLWPTGESSEVWTLGDARGALGNLKQKYYADSWVSFREGEIDPNDYMNAIDFFVYFPSEDSSELICREAFEAAATGRVVILPEKFRNAHADTALYSDVTGVAQLVDYYWRNKEAYLEQTSKARKGLTHMFGLNGRIEQSFHGLFGLV
ncbi:glycosyltransferase family 2 protein [Glutamicibacter sp. HZAU]|uniref:glycosyltransferase family 2 protein n=1 Tax=Glutamicibacter sp. HZAU TaxID=2049891 RepID=UPI000FFC9228|nr:glycosyltransferase [Glutamicibacter sp. HZAU]RWZ83212.1 glycosyltransferase [Glutamicibacter sp. HZAU]